MGGSEVRLTKFGPVVKDGFNNNQVLHVESEQVVMKSSGGLQVGFGNNRPPNLVGGVKMQEGIPCDRGMMTSEETVTETE